MQFIQNMMTSYLVNPVRCKDKNYTLDTTKAKTIKQTDAGGGDFDYSSQSEQDTLDYLENLTSPEGYFSKQEETTKTLVQTLENEIAESKEDIRNLCNHIYNAEESFPKHWEACNKLRELCRQQIDILSMETTKLKRKSDRFDMEMRELEQRIDSWQCIIERARQVQVQEDLYEH